MNIKRIILASLAIFIISHLLIFLTCGWLFNWVYELPPTNIWLSYEQIISPVNQAISMVTSIIKSVFYVIIFALFFKAIPGKGILKGIIFSILLWIVGAFSGILPMPAYMTINWGVILYWLIQSLSFQIIWGILLGLIYKEK